MYQIWLWKHLSRCSVYSLRTCTPTSKITFTCQNNKQLFPQRTVKAAIVFEQDLNDFKLFIERIEIDAFHQWYYVKGFTKLIIQVLDRTYLQVKLLASWKEKSQIFHLYRPSFNTLNCKNEIFKRYRLLDNVALDSNLLPIQSQFWSSRYHLWSNSKLFLSFFGNVFS